MMMIRYNVSIAMEDDGRNSPFQIYSRCFCPEFPLDESETRKRVMEDLKLHLVEDTGYDLQDLLDEPAFKTLQVSGIEVINTISSVGCYIDGPAKKENKVN